MKHEYKIGDIVFGFGSTNVSVVTGHTSTGYTLFCPYGGGMDHHHSPEEIHPFNRSGAIAALTKWWHSMADDGVKDITDLETVLQREREQWEFGRHNKYRNELYGLSKYLKIKEKLE